MTKDTTINIMGIITNLPSNDSEKKICIQRWRESFREREAMIVQNLAHMARGDDLISGEKWL